MFVSIAIVVLITIILTTKTIYSTLYLYIFKSIAVRL